LRLDGEDRDNQCEDNRDGQETKRKRAQLNSASNGGALTSNPHED
jgi:hypothetical protein